MTHKKKDCLEVNIHVIYEEMLSSQISQKIILSPPVFFFFVSDYGNYVNKDKAKENKN